MKTLGNILGFLIVSAVSAVVAFWPEAIGYFIYRSVDPHTELGRIVLALGLLVVGGGLSVFMFVLGGIIFTAGLSTLGSSRRW